jgi:hypothetical protein
MGLYNVTDSLDFIQYPPPNRNLYPSHSSAAAAAVVMVRAVDGERLKITEGVVTKSDIVLSPTFESNLIHIPLARINLDALFRSTL